MWVSRGKANIQSPSWICVAAACILSRFLGYFWCFLCSFWSPKLPSLKACYLSHSILHYWSEFTWNIQQWASTFSFRVLFLWAYTAWTELLIKLHKEEKSCTWWPAAVQKHVQLILHEADSVMRFHLNCNWSEQQKCKMFACITVTSNDHTKSSVHSEIQEVFRAAHIYLFQGLLKKLPQCVWSAQTGTSKQECFRNNSPVCWASNSF